MFQVQIEVRIGIEGYIKGHVPTAYTVYGFLKHLMTKRLVSRGVLKELTFPTKDASGYGVFRCCEASPNWSPGAKVKWWLTPWAHISGILPLTLNNMAKIGITPSEAKELFKLIYGVPKMRVVIKREPSFTEVEYDQGMRDFYSTIGTSNPHPIKMIKAEGEWEVEVVYQPSPYDATKVPKMLDEIVNYNKIDGSTYNEVIAKLIVLGLADMKGEVPSTLGGRKFHRIYIKVDEIKEAKVEGGIDLSPKLKTVLPKLEKFSYTKESEKLMEDAAGAGFSGYSGGHRRGFY